MLAGLYVLVEDTREDDEAALPDLTLELERTALLETAELLDLTAEVERIELPFPTVLLVLEAELTPLAPEVLTVEDVPEVFRLLTVPPC